MEHAEVLHLWRFTSGDEKAGEEQADSLQQTWPITCHLIRLGFRNWQRPCVYGIAMHNAL